MITFEERERMRDRATSWFARWFGLTLAADVLRLLGELETDGPDQRAAYAAWDAWRPTRYSRFVGLVAPRWAPPAYVEYMHEAHSASLDRRDALKSEREALLADLAAAENRARDAEATKAAITARIKGDDFRNALVLRAHQSPNIPDQAWFTGFANGVDTALDRLGWLMPPGADPLKESGGSTTGDPGRPPQSTETSGGDHA